MKLTLFIVQNIYTNQFNNTRYFAVCIFIHVTTTFTRKTKYALLVNKHGMNTTNDGNICLWWKWLPHA